MGMTDGWMDNVQSAENLDRNLKVNPTEKQTHLQSQTSVCPSPFLHPAIEDAGKESAGSFIVIGTSACSLLQHIPLIKQQLLSGKKTLCATSRHC